MVLFLPKSEVIRLHDELVRNSPFDDLEGILNPNQLDSALNQLRMTIQGVSASSREFLHPTIFDMAAAYGFYLSRGHAFNSCNKRTAYVVMMTFLALNGYDKIFVEDENKHQNVMVAVAKGEMNKQQLADWLRTVTKRRNY